MKKYSLLINEEQLRQLTPISGTFDWEFISPHVITATDLDIQPIIGNALYQRLLDGIVDDDLSADELTLLNDYIAKPLAHWTMYHAYPTLPSKLIKSTLTRVETEDGSPVEMDEAARLGGNSKTKANFYTTRLIDYLGANSDLYTEYTTDIDGELEASEGKTSNFGFTFDSEVESRSSGGGSSVKGDMLKSTYDTNDSGVVDDTEKVNGKTVEENVPSGAVFTDTQIDPKEGENIIIDKTNPLAPIFSASGGETITTIPWTELVALTTRKTGDRFEVTTANPDDSVVYGFIILNSADTFNYYDTAIEAIEIITID